MWSCLLLTRVLRVKRKLAFLRVAGNRTMHCFILRGIALKKAFNTTFSSKKINSTAITSCVSGAMQWTLRRTSTIAEYPSNFLKFSDTKIASAITRGSYYLPRNMRKKRVQSAMMRQNLPEGRSGKRCLIHKGAGARRSADKMFIKREKIIIIIIFWCICGGIDSEVRSSLMEQRNWSRMDMHRSHVHAAEFVLVYVFAYAYTVYKPI